MKRQIKFALIAIFIFTLALPLFASDFNKRGLYDTPPEPRLLSPISDKVDLTGKEFLEFKWLSNFYRVDHYIFKIYKGYNMYGADLILKKEIGPNELSVKIEASIFQDAEVYTWCLQQVGLSGEKSDKGFSSFMVIKK